MLILVYSPFSTIPPGPNHVMPTVTRMSIDVSNWTLHVRVTLAPRRTGSAGVDVNTVLGLGTRNDNL